MKEFNVIIYNCNAQKFEPYNIIPYLIDCYKHLNKKDKPKTFDEFKLFITKNSLNQWWSRCEYEIILKDFPSEHIEKKIDVHQQVLLNIDIITNLLISIINESKKI